MSRILEDVNRRTQLAGHNRLEMLMFRLGSRQRFGINVFKVQEVIQCPPLTQVPNAHPVVRGVANLRGKTITIMDLGKALGRAGVRDTASAFVVVTEYNRSTQGFLVSGVDRIVNLNWDAIHPPPKGSGNNYMTAVTEIDNELVEIIDVEKVLAEVITVDTTVTDSLIRDGQNQTGGRSHHALVVDDSSVARNQVKQTLEQLGLDCTVARNGREALALLRNWADEGTDVSRHLSMVISDVEMPEMDGYALTSAVRDDARLQGLYIILHTSLSGVFNQALVQKVGADRFIPKFQPDDLANAVIERLKALNDGDAAG